MSIIAVGSVAYDSLKTPHGERDRVLGGSATYFSIAASLFDRVNLVGVVGEDFGADDLALLKTRDIGLEGLKVTEGRTFFWKGEYGDNLNEAITHETQLNVFAQFVPTIPDCYLDARMVFLGNIHPALQNQVIDQVGEERFVACDTMNLWINTTRDDLMKVLERIDLLFVNDGEAFLLTGETNVFKAGRCILDMGPGAVVIKRGEFGAAVLTKEDIALAPAFPMETVVDPTGAGDTFAAGFMGTLSLNGMWNMDGFRKALHVGTVLSSFNIENFSVERLKSVTRREVDERLERFRHFLA